MSHVVGCTGKKKYGTEKLAHEVAAASGGGRPLYPYSCPACGCWHLSKHTQQDAAAFRLRYERGQEAARVSVRAKLRGA